MATPRTIRRASIVAVATAMTLVGAAFAASWTTESTGTAGARSGSLQAVVVSTAVPSSVLFPGGVADAAMTVRNPNTATDVTVVSVVGSGPITSSSAACNAAGHGVTFVNAAGSWLIAKGATVTITLPRAVAMATTTAAECQDVSFSIPVKVTASAGATQTSVAPSTTTTTTTPTSTTSVPNTGPLFWNVASYDFPSTFVNSPREETFVLTNTSASAVGQVVVAIRMNGRGYAIAATDCPATLVSAASCNVTVEFNPEITGPSAATLEARSSASTVAAVSLTGRATSMKRLELSVPPGLDGSQTYTSFGEHAVGSTSPSQTVTVKNTGTQAITNITTRVFGDYSGDFVVTANGCASVTLQPEATCPLTVVFRPSSVGLRSASLDVMGSGYTSAPFGVSGRGK